ncbi:unnamed protein product, partial [Pylaiella littoralis]
ATRPVSTLRAGADASDGGDAADSEAVAAENKAIEEGAAAAKAVMDATDEFRAKQTSRCGRGSCETLRRRRPRKRRPRKRRRG